MFGAGNARSSRCSSDANKKASAKDLVSEGSNSGN